jgi:hypothetical protein
MNNLTECKSCGYTLRKNSNRTIKPVSINITILEEHTMKILYAKEDIPMCNECTDILININKELVELLE